MSEQGYAGVLGEINATANSSITLYQQVDQALQAVYADADGLVELLAGAGNAIDTSHAQSERDYGAILSAIAHTGQACDLHSALAFPDHAVEASTAGKQLGEAARLLGKVSRGFIHLQQQLTHDIGAEIKNHRNAILQNVYGSAGLGRTAIRFDAIASQEAIISASDTYKQRRIDEEKEVKAGQQLLETTKTTITPVEQEATTTTEGTPTAESILAGLEGVINALTPFGPVLALFPQRLEMLKKMHEDAGSILISWTTAPEDVKAKYQSIGNKLANLTLPINSEAINEHIGHITNSKRDIESAKNEVGIAKGMINWGRKYISTAIKNLRQYLGRRA